MITDILTYIRSDNTIITTIILICGVGVGVVLRNWLNEHYKHKEDDERYD